MLDPLLSSIVMTNQYLGAICYHFFIHYYCRTCKLKELTCLTLSFAFKDEIVASIEQTIATWTFLPAGNFRAPIIL